MGLAFYSDHMLADRKVAAGAINDDKARDTAMISRLL
jgi:hypothetical protein